MDRRVGTRLPSSTWTMAWLPRQTLARSRVHSTTWSACLIRWACGPIPGRQLAWSSAPARRRVISRRRRTGDGSQGRSPPIGSARRDGFTAGSAERRWRRIYGKSHDDSAWAGERGATELENPGHGGRVIDISNGLPGQGRPAELPGGGMPGPSDDDNGDAGTLPAPACLGHRGRYGGGKPPPPTVHPMRHASTLPGTEWQAPFHSSVC